MTVIIIYGYLVYGIKIYSLQNKKSSYLNKNNTFVNYLNSNNITCFYEDSNGTIWVGTDKGINIANKGNQFNFNPKYNNEKGIYMIRV